MREDGSLVLPVTPSPSGRPVVSCDRYSEAENTQDHAMCTVDRGINPVDVSSGSERPGRGARFVLIFTAKGAGRGESSCSLFQRPVRVYRRTRI